ncbi:MAG TPA: hypothetical protein VFB73_17290 [Chloroflexota bacterium]|nr:hypothetical protein [Chloroflexota bacterium]
MRYGWLVGLLACTALLATTAAPTALAAPLDHHRDGHERGHRDRDRDRDWHRERGGDHWFERTVVIQPATSRVEPVVVQIVTPTPTFQPSIETLVVPRVRQNILPALVQVLPTDLFARAPIRIVLVQPRVFVLVHPSLFWGLDDTWAANDLIAQLAAIAAGFEPFAFDGPYGRGVYLAFRDWD